MKTHEDVQHTPEPWAFVNAPQGYIRAEAHGECIAEMIHRVDHADRREPLDDKQLANARLMASAPELLRCLKRFRKNCPHDHYGVKELNCPLCTESEDAIAKAEGSKLKGG